METLTDKDIDNIVEAATECRVDIVKPDVNDEEGIIIDAEVQDLEPATVIGYNGDVGVGNELPSNTDSLDLYDIGKVEEATFANENADTFKESFNLSDEDMYKVLDVVANINKEKYKIYDNLPESIQKFIQETAEQNEIPKEYYDAIGRMIIQELIQDTDVESAFMDLEKALNEALNLPSLIDMYSEHTREVMEIHIPKMIEDIKDEHPEKAQMLTEVKNAFTEAYDFSATIKAYEESSNIRKAVKKSAKNFKRSLENFNFRAHKSNFKMNDITEAPEVLKDILINQPIDMALSYAKDGIELPESIKEIRKMSITVDDIEKFLILIARSCDTRDPHSIVDAAYMYYMIKNIIVLKHTQEAKTDFAAELISNICKTITFIRDKEADLNANNGGNRKR